MKQSVIIIGAGPGGLASAMLLAHAGLRVTVIERRIRVERIITPADWESKLHIYRGAASCVTGARWCARRSSSFGIRGGATR